MAAAGAAKSEPTCRPAGQILNRGRFEQTTTHLSFVLDLDLDLVALVLLAKNGIE